MSTEALSRIEDLDAEDLLPDVDDFESADPPKRQRRARPITKPQERASPDDKAGDGCLLIGPMGAGKTSLLLAMRQACMLRRKGEPQLHFVPDSDSMADLIARSLRIFLEQKNLPSTLGTSRYSFSIHEDRPSLLPWRAPRRKSLRMTILDGPGGALFPLEEESDRLKRRQIETFRKDLVVYGRRQARSLVFCVDSTEPRAPFLESHLPRLISELCTDTRPTKGGLAQPWPYLPFRRVLVLLTKIDALCSAVARGHAVTSSRRFRASDLDRGFIPLDPARLARLVEPVHQARTVLGNTLLPGIRAAMAPEAELAIGVCSAGGFLPQRGEAFLESSLSSTDGSAGALDHWQPFGIREALGFLVSGRESSSVKLVQGRDFLVGDEVPPLPLFCGDAPNHETPIQLETLP